MENTMNAKARSVRPALKFVKVLTLSAALMMPAMTMAGVIYQTGHIQYTNVNLNDDDDDVETVRGDLVPQDGIFDVFFQGFAATGATPPPLLLDTQGGGVSRIEPDSGEIHSMTITAADGFGFSAMAWSLNAPQQSDGTVSYSALDSDGFVIPLSSGSSLFDYPHQGNGEQKYNALTDGGSLIKTLIISTADNLILDLRQVSVNLAAIEGDPEPGPDIPEPSGLVIATAGAMIVFGAKTRMGRRRDR
jgi:hypothetical protein